MLAGAALLLAGFLASPTVAMDETGGSSKLTKREGEGSGTSKLRKREGDFCGLKYDYYDLGQFRAGPAAPNSMSVSTGHAWQLERKIGNGANGRVDSIAWTGEDLSDPDDYEKRVLHAEGKRTSDGRVIAKTATNGTPDRSQELELVAGSLLCSRRKQCPPESPHASLIGSDIRGDQPSDRRLANIFELASHDASPTDLLSVLFLRTPENEARWNEFASAVSFLPPEAGALRDLDAMLAVGVSSLEGIRHYHDNYLVQRDFKASNVMLDATYGMVRLIDLGGVAMASELLGYVKKQPEGINSLKLQCENSARAYFAARRKENRENSKEKVQTAEEKKWAKMWAKRANGGRSVQEGDQRRSFNKAGSNGEGTAQPLILPCSFTAYGSVYTPTFVNPRLHLAETFDRKHYKAMQSLLQPYFNSIWGPTGGAQLQRALEASERLGIHLSAKNPEVCANAESTRSDDLVSFGLTMVETLAGTFSGIRDLAMATCDRDLWGGTVPHDLDVNGCNARRDQGPEFNLNLQKWLALDRLEAPPTTVAERRKVRERLFTLLHPTCAISMAAAQAYSEGRYQQLLARQGQNARPAETFKDRAQSVVFEPNDPVETGNAVDPYGANNAPQQQQQQQQRQQQKQSNNVFANNYYNDKQRSESMKSGNNNHLLLGGGGPLIVEENPSPYPFKKGSMMSSMSSSSSESKEDFNYKNNQEYDKFMYNMVQQQAARYGGGIPTYQQQQHSVASKDSSSSFRLLQTQEGQAAESGENSGSKKAQARALRGHLQMAAVAEADSQASTSADASVNANAVASAVAKKDVTYAYALNNGPALAVLFANHDPVIPGKPKVLLPISYSLDPRDKTAILNGLAFDRNADMAAVAAYKEALKSDMEIEGETGPFAAAKYITTPLGKLFTVAPDYRFRNLDNIRLSTINSPKMLNRPGSKQAPTLNIILEVLSRLMSLHARGQITAEEAQRQFELARESLYEEASKGSFKNPLTLAPIAVPTTALPAIQSQYSCINTCRRTLQQLRSSPGLVVGGGGSVGGGGNPIGPDAKSPAEKHALDSCNAVRQDAGAAATLKPGQKHNLNFCPLVAQGIASYTLDGKSLMELVSAGVLSATLTDGICARSVCLSQAPARLQQNLEAINGKKDRFGLQSIFAEVNKCHAGQQATKDGECVLFQEKLLKGPTTGTLLTGFNNEERIITVFDAPDAAQPGKRKLRVKWQRPNPPHQLRGNQVISTLPRYEKIGTCEEMKQRDIAAGAPTANYFDLCKKSGVSGPVGRCLCIPMEAPANPQGPVQFLRVWVKDIFMAEKLVATVNAALEEQRGGGGGGNNNFVAEQGGKGRDKNAHLKKTARVSSGSIDGHDKYNPDPSGYDEFAKYGGKAAFEEQKRKMMKQLLK